MSAAETIYNLPGVWLSRFDHRIDCPDSKTWRRIHEVCESMRASNPGDSAGLWTYLRAKAWPISRPRFGPLNEPGRWRSPHQQEGFDQRLWLDLLRDPDAVCGYVARGFECGSYTYPTGLRPGLVWRCAACHRERN